MRHENERPGPESDAGAHAARGCSCHGEKIVLDKLSPRSIAYELSVTPLGEAGAIWALRCFKESPILNEVEFRRAIPRRTDGLPVDLAAAMAIEPTVTELVKPDSIIGALFVVHTAVLPMGKRPVLFKPDGRMPYEMGHGHVDCCYVKTSWPPRCPGQTIDEKCISHDAWDAEVDKYCAFCCSYLGVFSVPCVR